MKLLRHLSPQLALAGIVALQISCGDSSGPGKTVASIEASSSTAITALPGTPVTEIPSVVLRDANGNTVSGVAVTFAVTSGGGSITGEHAVSNSSGIATVGSWTLGSAPGTNTLTATAAGLPAVTFTAEGGDPCANATTHTVGTTSNGKLSPSDCRLSDGSFVDFYSLSVPSAGTYLFTQTGNFDTYLAILTTTLGVIGINDDFGGAANTSTIKALLPAGSFVLGANSFAANDTGTYTLSSATSSAEVTNCEDVFLVRGISSAQTLQTTDCSINGFLADEYIVFLQSGQSITTSMTSTAVDSYIEIYADGSPSSILASNDNIDGTTQNAQVAFTASANGFYIIRARSAATGAIGAYTLAVQ